MKNIRPNLIQALARIGIAKSKQLYVLPLSLALGYSILGLVNGRPSILNTLLYSFFFTSLIVAIRVGVSSRDFQDAKKRYQGVFVTLLTSSMVFIGMGDVQSIDVAYLFLIMMIYVTSLFFLSYAVSDIIKNPPSSDIIVSPTAMIKIITGTLSGVAFLTYLHIISPYLGELARVTLSG